MGKHKSKKSKKNKKSKRCEKYSSSSNSSSDEWVEKEIKDIPKKRQKRYDTSSSESSEHEKEYSRSRSSGKKEKEQKRYVSSSESSEDEQLKHGASKKVGKEHESPKISNEREDWMSLPSSFLTASNLDRRKEREEQKRQEREDQKYDPRKCERELNPYWKHGGDGLPKFQKPRSEDNWSSKKANTSSKKYKWKKSKDEIHSKEETEIVDKNVKETSNDELLSESDLNQLAAKMVKAEILGNTKLANELKEKLERARQNLKGTKDDTVILTQTDAQGRSQPLKLQSQYGETSSHKKKQKVETHQGGQRVRYFADDDKYSLKQMFENEKYSSIDDSNKQFVNLAANIRKNDDLDDLFADNIRRKESDSKIDSRNKDRAVAQHQKISASLDNCSKCIQSEKMSKHLMISMGETVYLSLPVHEPLTDGHCLIIPIRHVPCATQLDENEWSDIKDMRKSLVKMFDKRNEEVIFFESATALTQFPHMSLECIPIPKEEGSSVVIYFKKAIDECETEWSQNKKLVSLKGRDVRKAIPKGLPYFCVSFGMEEGYAHVIEDEKLFPRNFAQEIIGGMLDLHHSRWRKPKRQNFEEQSKRVLEFSSNWKDFDCTS